MLRLLACATLLATGCATSLSSGHSPKVLEKGKFEANVGTGILVPAGVLASAWDAGKKTIEDASKGDRPVSLEEAAASDAAIAVAAILIAPPSPVTELTARYGVYDRFDVGFRYSGPAIRGEVHGQLVDEGPWQVAAGAGLARHAFGSTFLDLLEKFKLAEFKRTDVDVSVIGGREGKFGAIYAGAKLVYSKYSSEGLFVNGDRITVVTPEGRELGSVELDLGHSFIYGGLLGWRLGYEYVWLTGELGVYGSSFRPNILGKERDLGGLVVYPMLGLVARY